MWAPAVDADGVVRDGAWVAEFTGLLDLSCWPAGMRVIVRKERPHPGAQLRNSDVDGNRRGADRRSQEICRCGGWKTLGKHRAPR